MKLTALHLLLTYECNFECDHCFVWGGPRQSGTMSLEDIRQILHQSDDLSTVEWIYFEGGEPFLYYPILIEGVEDAAARGYEVGVVTNGYWATQVEDARAWLRPLAGLIADLSVSSDLYHWDDMLSQQVRNASDAGAKLGIPMGTISVAQPEETERALASLMFRGRAAEKLAPSAPRARWETFDECPYESLDAPGRVHLDPLGYVHVCQGISLGNLFQTRLEDICRTYEPDTHPIVAPLLKGGPAELARRYNLHPEPAYVDACHLCYDSRVALRHRYPDVLTPDQMYGLLER
ncbi:MAG: radical SAM protein [Anaerolineae bacterium]|jgi:hypothetical protein